MRKNEPRVTLEDIGNEIGLTAGGVLALIDDLSAVEHDWTGRRPSVPESLAAQIVSTYREQQAEHERAWADYQSFISDRKQRRERLADETFEAGIAEYASANPVYAITGPDGGVPGTEMWHRTARSQEARAAGHAARREALASFDASEPELSFEQWSLLEKTA